MKLSKNSYVRCISLTNSARNERIEGLQLNRFINIKLKYECLEEVEVLDKSVHEGKENAISEIIMNAKKNGVLLFHRIE